VIVNMHGRTTIKINYIVYLSQCDVCTDRKQKFRTQYLQQGATPCAVSDALHYFAMTRPFLRNILIYEETYSPTVNPDWSTMTTHTHHVLRFTKCGAVLPRPNTP
jgi:hypothetical protein